MDASSDARERVLHVAEHLFSERGYTAVTLRDLAQALHMKQASLYHHAPGGKEELFVTVTERSFYRHQQALTAAIAAAGPALPAQLQAVGQWLLAQPPINVARLTRSDLPALSPAHAHRLAQLTGETLLAPLQRMFTAANVTRPDPTALAGYFLFLMEAIHDAQRYTNQAPTAMLNDVIALLLEGVERR